MGGLVARAGLPLRAVPEAPAAAIDAAFAPVWAQEATVQHVVQDLFVGIHARTALPGMLSIVAEWKPDVIVRETMEFASLLAADYYGVPQVRVGVHLTSQIDSDGMFAELAATALNVAPERLLDSPLLTRAPHWPDEPEHEALRFRTESSRAGRRISSTSASAPRRRCRSTSPASTARRSTRSPTCP